MTTTVTCPSCATTFPVDPGKIPEGGVNARCSACRDVFFVGKPEAHSGSTAVEPTPDEVTPVAPPPREGEGEDDAEPAGWDLPGSTGPDVAEVEEPVGLEQELRDVGDQDTQETDVPGDQPAAGTEDWSIGGVEDWDQSAEASPRPDDLRPEVAGEVVSEAEIAQPTEPEEGQAPAAVPSPAEPPQGFQLGRRDPNEKARRLARVLVSDMIMYNPERHARALENHTLREDFEEEIKKSWEEYVEQVGQEMARDTTYFRDALNDILARGEQVFDRVP